MKKLFVSVVLLALFQLSFGQIDSLPEEPQVKYKVNKEYDEDGNLIRYDSSVVSFYSNGLDPSLNIFSDSTNWYGNMMPDLDSLFQMMPNYNDVFGDSIMNSFFNHSFFDDPFFIDPFNNNFKSQFDFDHEELMRNFYQEMDSLRNRYRDKMLQPQSQPKPRKIRKTSTI